MTKELRLMREDLKQAISQSVQNNITMQTALDASASGKTLSKDTNKNSEVQMADQTQTKVPLFGKGASEAADKENNKEVKVNDLLDEELSAEAKQEVERMVDIFIEAFSSKQQKEMAIKYTVMPLNQIVKMPNDQKWRNVLTSSSFLKQVSNINAEALDNMLQGIGFTKVAEKTFKFSLSSTSDLVSVQTDASKQLLIKPGNLQTIGEAVKLLNAKLAELKKPSAAPSSTIQTT